MGIIDIEYEIEKKFITILRAIFEFDNKFVYNNNEEQSKLIITTEYPEKQSDFKKPHLIVSNISYQFNCQEFFANNFAYDYAKYNIESFGQKFMTTIPYSVNFLCIGEFFNSKDLANTLVNYISFVFYDMFDAAGLNILNVSKGATSHIEQFPEKVFQTPVIVQGQLYWVGSKEMNFDTVKNIISQKIQINLQN